MPPLAIPAAKRPRIAISNAQKKALRAWYFDSSVPKRTLADASTWWQTKYGYSLSSSTAADILSAKKRLP
jgi:Zn/Cd-binding protein ZinT